VGSRLVLGALGHLTSLNIAVPKSLQQMRKRPKIRASVPGGMTSPNWMSRKGEKGIEARRLGQKVFDTSNNP
jgi:hypothetical protein